MSALVHRPPPPGSLTGPGRWPANQTSIFGDQVKTGASDILRCRAAYWSRSRPSQLEPKCFKALRSLLLEVIDTWGINLSVYDLIAKLDTYRADLANDALDARESTDNPTLAFFPNLRVKTT